MTITTFQMLCKDIGPLVSQFVLFHSSKSHDFFDANGCIYSSNAFASSVIRINPLLHMPKTKDQLIISFTNMQCTFWWVYIKWIILEIIEIISLFCY